MCAAAAESVWPTRENGCESAPDTSQRTYEWREKYIECDLFFFFFAFACHRRERQIMIGLTILYDANSCQNLIQSVNERTKKRQLQTPRKKNIIFALQKCAQFLWFGMIAALFVELFLLRCLGVCLSFGELPPTLL